MQFRAGEGEAGELQASGRRKPKVVVLSCAFGGGHKAAANAVSSYLSRSYEVRRRKLKGEGVL